MKNVNKGDYGFYNKKKIRQSCITAVMFIIVVAVYLLGVIQTGSNKNILTIVAILGVLPASKSAVSMIMLIRFRTIDEKVYKKLYTYENTSVGSGLLVYDLILVLDEKAVKTDAFYIHGSDIIAYVPHNKMPSQDIAKHLKNFLSNQGKGGCGVKVCTDAEKFLEDVEDRAKVPVDEKGVARQKKLKETLLAFSM